MRFLIASLADHVAWQYHFSEKNIKKLIDYKFQKHIKSIEAKVMRLSPSIHIYQTYRHV